MGQTLSHWGLNDEDTKQEVLSRVEEMTLDATVTFIEASETGSLRQESWGVRCQVL